MCRRACNGVELLGYLIGIPDFYLTREQVVPHEHRIASDDDPVRYEFVAVADASGERESATSDAERAAEERCV
jgi:hypothetical protein